MIDFEIKQLIPRFLLRDKNGKAMAYAIEAALRAMNSVAKTGVDLIANVETMPEWRLDELAWEYNCLYDYAANINEKRRWIREAVPIYRVYGTVKAIYNYLEGVFDEVEVEENWQYGSEPFHFRVTVGGEWTDAKEAWADQAIEAAKNVRSILDSFGIGSSCWIIAGGSEDTARKFQYPVTGELLAGTWPEIATVGGVGVGIIEVSENDLSQKFSYPVAGMEPEIATIGSQSIGAVDVDADSVVQTIIYPVCGGNENGANGL